MSVVRHAAARDAFVAETSVCLEVVPSASMRNLKQRAAECPGEVAVMESCPLQFGCR